MAAPMIPPAAAPAFLAAHGLEGAEILPLAGDASFRRYFRVVRGGDTAVLMDAPPAHEDVGPFLKVAQCLLDRGFAPPRPLAVDRDQGLLLLEDFGDDRVGPLLAREPSQEHAGQGLGLFGESLGQGGGVRRDDLATAGIGQRLEGVERRLLVERHEGERERITLRVFPRA